MIDVVNLQRKVRLDLAAIRIYIQELGVSFGDFDGRVYSVAFVSDNRMRQLNGMFRGIDSTTDVLSFPWSEPSASAEGQFGEDRATNWPPAHAGGSDFIGDIVISAEQAAKQAAENDLTLDGEIKQLILHGLLHLCGYDHERDNGEMNAREIYLRKKLGI